MSNHNMITQAATYLQAQEQTLRTIPQEDVPAFVIASIHGFATEHFEPAVHAVSETIPQTETPWLMSELSNSADITMVNPSLVGLLPARYSKTYRPGSHSDGLLLPMGGSLLKIKTGGGDYFGDNTQPYISMRITEYNHADPAERADYTQKRALLGDSIAPDATIITPRTCASYGQWPEPEIGSFTAEYLHEGIAAPEDIHLSSEDATQPPYETFLGLHKGITGQARLALAGLRTLLR